MGAINEYVILGIGFALGALTTLGVNKFVACRKNRCADGGKGKGRRPANGESNNRHPPAELIAGATEIYVGNLSYDLTDEQLNEAFAKFGEIKSARIITNKYNGKSKGFGFVHMAERGDAEKAVAALNEKELLGRKLRCNIAKNS